MTREVRIPPPPGFPYFGWTEDRIKRFVLDTPLKVGDPMIIYNGQGGMHHYVLARVENPALGKQKRVLLSKSSATGGATFYSSGKNCFSPKGRSKMLPLIPELIEHLSDTTDVWLATIPYGKGM